MGKKLGGVKITLWLGCWRYLCGRRHRHRHHHCRVQSSPWSQKSVTWLFTQLSLLSSAWIQVHKHTRVQPASRLWFWSWLLLELVLFTNFASTAVKLKIQTNASEASTTKCKWRACHKLPQSYCTPQLMLLAVFFFSFNQPKSLLRQSV